MLNMNFEQDIQSAGNNLPTGQRANRVWVQCKILFSRQSAKLCYRIVVRKLHIFCHCTHL